MNKELEKVFIDSVEAFNEDQYNNSDDERFEEVYNSAFNPDKKQGHKDLNRVYKYVGSKYLDSEELENLMLPK